MKKGAIIAIVIAAIAIPTAVYAASPLFINTYIDEPAPGTFPDDSMQDKGSEDAPMEDKNDGMADEAKPGVFTQLFGDFVGVGDGVHSAEGVAKVVRLDGSSTLRLEDFRSTNGPDLYVYVSTDKTASEFVDLGRLKANIGSQNYAIPDGTDLLKYDTVLIWCKSFSVLFGSAELAERQST